MKCGTQMAVAVLGGYALGRSHKTRLAVLLALLAAGGRLPIDQRELLRRTPLGEPLDKLTGDLRTQLVDSGMAVVKKAASSRIDSLSDRLQERAEAMRVPTRVGREEAEEPEEPRRERRARRARAPEGRRERVREEEEPEEYADEYAEGEDEYYGDEDEYEGDEYEPEEAERRRPARPVRSEPRGRAPRGGEARLRRGRVTR